MVYEINTERLRELEITAHQYVILRLVLDNELFILSNYIRDINAEEDWKKDMTYLKEKNYVSNFPPKLSQLTVNSVIVTDLLRDKFTFKSDPFYEIYKAYPVKVTRPDGRVEYLRREYDYCRELYSTVIRGNPDKHFKILEALFKEITFREQQGQMPYFKSLSKWISSKGWESFLEEDDKLRGLSMKQKQRTYGTTIE